MRFKKLLIDSQSLTSAFKNCCIHTTLCMSLWIISVLLLLLSFPPCPYAQLLNQGVLQATKVLIIKKSGWFFSSVCHHNQELKDSNPGFCWSAIFKRCSFTHHQQCWVFFFPIAFFSLPHNHFSNSSLSIVMISAPNILTQCKHICLKKAESLWAPMKCRGCIP